MIETAPLVLYAKIRRCRLAGFCSYSTTWIRFYGAFGLGFFLWRKMLRFLACLKSKGILENTHTQASPDFIAMGWLAMRKHPKSKLQFIFVFCVCVCCCFFNYCSKSAQGVKHESLANFTSGRMLLHVATLGRGMFGSNLEQYYSAITVYFKWNVKPN